MSYENFDPNDLLIQTYSTKPEGNFGPHRIPHGIRAIHLPTGTVVTCDAERSQHKNRHDALMQLWDQVQGKPTYQDLTDEVEALKDWRRLAMQFDGHRMQAMSMLKMIATGNFDVEEVRQFIAAAPVSGNEHLKTLRVQAFLAGVEARRVAILNDEQAKIKAEQFAESTAANGYKCSYFDADGTLRNPDGSRSIFDDVDQ